MKNLLLTLTFAGLLAGCTAKPGSTPKASEPNAAPALNPLALALAPHQGESRLDLEIVRVQQQLRDGRNMDTGIEQLGWLFVDKARAGFDSGFYKLAEQCALALEVRPGRRLDALLLRGHVLQSLHRFKQAEALAIELVAQRGLSFDYGLLGDVQVDLGRVEDAAQAYQRMLDLKPDPRGYTRAAHIRWLKGDLNGAIELMRMAARGSSPRDPEAAAWMHTRLAQYLWQSHAENDAALALDMALEFQKNYAPALLLRGRMLLGASRVNDALPVLREAAALLPLPEYQWTLSEALRAAGRAEEAQLIQTQLSQRGAASDPRTYALFLATQGDRSGSAVRLAASELEDRADVFTHDALAWALAAAGSLDKAQEHMMRALSEGTIDPRLSCHAAVIFAAAERFEEARHWCNQAQSFWTLLLPSETDQLRHAIEWIASCRTSDGNPQLLAATSTLSCCGN